MRQNTFFTLLTVLTIVQMCSCSGNGSMKVELKTIDSLIETRPDSSLILLRRDSAHFVASNKALHMSYILSRTEAEDKLYMVHKSDSAMLPAAKYFDSHGTPLQRTRAWYILGRVYCDMLLYGRALFAFDKALSASTENTADICLYKSRAATWAGYVYEENNIHDKALHYNEISYKNARLSNRLSPEIYSLRDIGRSYSYMDMNKEAIPYYRRAAEKAKALNNVYIYNMVMEELAGIYVEEKMFSEAYKALQTPFINGYGIDLSSHYYAWSIYYDGINKIDSALFYNKQGMAYSPARINEDAALDMARLYAKVDSNYKAIEYYEQYVAYADTTEKEQIIVYKDILSRIERMLDVERLNVDLTKSKLHLTILLFTLVLATVIALFFAIRYFTNAKKRLEEQQERVNRYLKQNISYSNKIKANEQRIILLEKELSSSNDTLSELRRKLIKNETEILQKQNERIVYEHKHHELLVANFTNTDVFKLYHNPTAQPSPADYHRLCEALNNTYNDFTFRLKDFYPRINDNGIWICCMIKTGLSAKQICNMSPYSYNSLSMAKSRLYQKMFNKKGSAKDLDSFIGNF